MRSAWRLGQRRELLGSGAWEESWLESGVTSIVRIVSHGRKAPTARARSLQPQHLTILEKANRFFQAPELRLFALGGFDPGEVPSAVCGR